MLGDRLDRHGGGKGANAAVAAARLGADVRLVAAVGDDDLGAQALEELAAEGVGLEGAERLSDVPTGAALIVVDAAGENQIAVGAGANARVGETLVGRALPAAARRRRCRAGELRDPARRDRRGGRAWRAPRTSRWCSTPRRCCPASSRPPVRG